MNTVIQHEISNMSLEEKIILVEDLWDLIASSKDEIPLTAAQIEELDRRLENYVNNPDSTVSWEAMKSKLSKSKGM